jgi:hypothetical protein
MEKITKKGISMISAASHALKFYRESGSHEKAMNRVGRVISDERNELTKLGMIAAASKALSIAEKNPGLADKQIVNQVMAELPALISSIESQA